MAPWDHNTKCFSILIDYVSDFSNLKVILRNLQASVTSMMLLYPNFLQKHILAYFHLFIYYNASAKHGMRVCRLPFCTVISQLVIEVRMQELIPYFTCTIWLCKHYINKLHDDADNFANKRQNAKRLFRKLEVIILFRGITTVHIFNVHKNLW